MTTLTQIQSDRTVPLKTKKGSEAESASGSISHRYGSKDPDSLVKGTDPRIQIRNTNTSRIQNTESNCVMKAFSIVAKPK